MADPPTIHVESLEKTYRDGWFRRRGVQALTGVSFHVEPGEIFGLLGPNGAGKTTFIKILLGIARKSGGSAQLLGWPAGDRRGRRRVGYLPEHLRIPGHQNARTALEYYGKLSGMSGAEVRARRDVLLETVGLAGREKDSTRKYSKGMLQRLGLAQALLHDPQLLMLDEPTDGLDPVGRSHVRAILKRLKGEGKTIFLNSHLLSEVEMICDRVAILDRGRLKYVGPVSDVAGRASEAAELEVHLEVAGDESQVRAALNGEPLDAWEQISSSSFRAALRLPNQEAVDACIDRLRAGGVSIISLSRSRVSLEDAFLKMLERK
ncbi:MAG: ABC transporter ATP-binding protein [Planctomycetes bacterium]|nr:ABC transporter ATP-binding protein [Planctomycetota bacterium]